MSTIIEWPDGSTSVVGKEGGFWYYTRNGVGYESTHFSSLKENVEANGGRIVRPAKKSARKSSHPTHLARLLRA